VRPDAGGAARRGAPPVQPGRRRRLRTLLYRSPNGAPCRPGRRPFRRHAGDARRQHRSGARPAHFKTS
jgi:hypothetical protein